MVVIWLRYECLNSDKCFEHLSRGNASSPFDIIDKKMQALAQHFTIFEHANSNLPKTRGYQPREIQKLELEQHSRPPKASNGHFHMIGLHITVENFS